MSGLIPQAFIDDLLDRIDIVDVVDSRVKLKKTGKNYSACCPFHDEKTPSFTVSPDKQFYYCFGCGASGNALGFVMDFDHSDFPEAVEQLARLAGVNVPREEAKQDNPADRLRRQIYDILEKANSYYRQQLKSNDKRGPAVSYLRQRGLTGEIAKQFGMGFAPPGWDNLLNHLGTDKHQQHLLTEAGMLIEKAEDGRRYDRFRNRIMFPIRDLRGRVIGFGGRVLGDDKPKYLNSPETPVFHKGKELYGLYEARQAYRQIQRLLVVEGYMDVVALAQFGIRYACATLGTACGEDHLHKAFKHTSEVVFCFDGDNAGRQAAHRALENSLPAMEDGRQVKFLFLPEGEDPDSLVRQIGSDKFEQLITHAIPLEEFLFDSQADNINLHSMEGRATFSKRVAPMLHRLPAGVFRELMFASLAQRTGLPLDTLLELTELPPPAAPIPDKPTRSPDSQKKQEQRETQAPVAIPSPQPAAPHNPESAPATKRRPTPQPRTTKNPGRTAPHLISLLLQTPALAAQVADIHLLQQSQDSDLQLFAHLVELLQKRPHYSINRVLGYWQASRPTSESSRLAQLATSELLQDIRQLSPFDSAEEFQDTLRRILKQLQRQQGTSRLEELQQKGLDKLSEEEKREYVEELKKARHSP